MHAALSSETYRKGFDNEKGARIITKEEMPCLQLSTSAFRAEREKVPIILPLDRKMVCSAVVSWLSAGVTLPSFFGFVPLPFILQHFDCIDSSSQGKKNVSPLLMSHVYLLWTLWLPNASKQIRHFFWSNNRTMVEFYGDPPHSGETFQDIMEPV